MAGQAGQAVVVMAILLAQVVQALLGKVTLVVLEQVAQ
jgi:hypothetical protein